MHFRTFTPRVRILTRSYLKRFNRLPRYQPMLLIVTAFATGIAIDRNFNCAMPKPGSDLRSDHSSVGIFCAACRLANRGPFDFTKYRGNRRNVASHSMAAYPTTKSGLYVDELDRPVVLEEQSSDRRASGPLKPFNLWPARSTKPKNCQYEISFSSSAMRGAVLSWQSASGHLFCNIKGAYPDLQPGDQLRIVGFSNRSRSF